MDTQLILSASSAARRMACPGSWRLEKQFPKKDSEYSREGDAAHWVASNVLLGVNMVGSTLTPHGELITDEMIEGAELYAAEINVVKNKIPYGVLHVEEKLHIKVIHADEYGTPDVWIYDKYKDILSIWDYKFGHSFVEVFENPQLIMYAAGILDTLPEASIKTQVDLYIIQPRSYHREGPVREWFTSYGELATYFSRLVESEKKATGPNAKCIPSPECNYCDARHACEALQQAALTAVDTASLSIPHDLPANELGNELRYMQRAARMLKDRITGLEEEALAKIKKGERVTFYKAENANGLEVWEKPVEEVAVLGSLYGMDLMKPSEPITPKQAVKKGIPENIIKSYSITRIGKLKLVQTDEKDMRKIFKK